MKINSRLLFLFLSSLGIVGVLLSCQLAPTKMGETRPNEIEFLQLAIERPVQIKPSTIFLDTRPPFEFSMFHVKGAVNVQLKGLPQPESAPNSQLEEEYFRVARRLALLGIDPQSEVVIVGQGPGGRGEEGRLAWLLYYLGVHKVQVVGVDYFKKGLTNAEAEPRPNAVVWKPQLNVAVVSSPTEVKGTLNQKSDDSQRIALLDVRAKDSYFERQRGGGYKTPDLQALHVEWREFFDQKGRPNPQIKAKLEDIGLQRDKRIVVLSDDGTQGGAVTMALLALGFRNAANLAGGWAELMKPNAKAR